MDCNLETIFKKKIMRSRIHSRVGEKEEKPIFHHTEDQRISLEVQSRDKKVVNLQIKNPHIIHEKVI